MTHEAHSGEDLLRDSRALVPRVQLAWQDDRASVTVLAGFRGESLSLYFGPDPVFHFNGRGDLRRAFVGGRLVKAEHGRLVVMDRVHLGHTVELRSEALSDAKQEAMLANVAERLVQLREALAAGRAIVEGEVPPDGDAFERLVDWLADHTNPAPAESPRVG